MALETSPGCVHLQRSMPFGLTRPCYRLESNWERYSRKRHLNRVKYVGGFRHVRKVDGLGVGGRFSAVGVDKLLFASSRVAFSVALSGLGKRGNGQSNERWLRFAANSDQYESVSDADDPILIQNSGDGGEGERSNNFLNTDNAGETSTAEKGSPVVLPAKSSWQKFNGNWNPFKKGNSTVQAREVCGPLLQLSVVGHLMRLLRPSFPFPGLASSASSQTRVEIEQQERQTGRRHALATISLLCSVPIMLTQKPGKLLAEEAKEDENSLVKGLLSLFDPNETTKQGKKLPKAYLSSARDVVRSLRASFSEESPSEAKFRKNADSAKGAIREYISNWRGAKLVDAEDSYQALERVLRGLSEFYSKKGPSAVLPQDVRSRILDDLQKADDAL